MNAAGGPLSLSFLRQLLRNTAMVYKRFNFDKKVVGLVAPPQALITRKCFIFCPPQCSCLWSYDRARVCPSPLRADLQHGPPC